jgi:hypothetical protein
LGNVDLIRGKAGPRHLGHPGQVVLETGFEDAGLRSRLSQDRRRKSPFLAKQREEQMLDVDLLMIIGGGAALGRPESFLYFLREAVEIHGLIIQPYNYLRQARADFILSVDG